MKKIILLLLLVFSLGVLQAVQVQHIETQQNIRSTLFSKSVAWHPFSPLNKHQQKAAQYSSKLLTLSLVIIAIGAIFAVVADIVLGALIMGIGIVILLFAVL